MAPEPGSSDDPFHLEGVAVVTGASAGIGAHLVRLLARRGVTVVAAARRVERVEALADDLARTDGPDAGGRVVPCRCDVTDDGQLADLVPVAEGRGPLTVVVNNAGSSDAPARAIDEDPSDFRRAVEVNLNATFVLSGLAARAMVAAGTAGSIVNVASIHGLVAAAPNTQAGYVAAKAGVLGLTRELAAQWARHRIRVNALAPGYFPTELTAEMLDGDAGQRFVERNTLLGRTGQLAELDGPFLLLASAAGSYVTGQTLTVDGGWTSR